ncbi:porin [Algoriphagus aestuariicola]|uniref:Porin n=1 Tax=Algoriphagus aestuariicola TaxID=1852016 RepID=A0ABS3BT64_9BACT|nr:porin [Algoriphagus aestuariicola]MBN7801540.1 porin [Algoriphagus aestuariicola]
MNYLQSISFLNLLLFFVATFGCVESLAQAVEAKEENLLKISGFLEAYYSYDFGNPASSNKPPFIYSYNRHNEFNINLGMVAFQYSKDRIRSNFALMAGTYSNANLAAEPGVLKNVFEANVGYKLSENQNLWIDMGILPSHIGFESAIGTANLNLTRSILADNSPYYESGLRLSYSSPNQKWYLAALALNGWQRIQRVEGNSLMSFGTQATFTSGNFLINSSTFIGTDSPDTERKMRYFHNLYSQISLTPRWKVILGLDMGMQQSEPMGSDYDTWISPVLIAQVQMNDKISLAGRLEQYTDRDGVIISTESPEGFQTLSASLNLDWKLSENLMWRTEYRYFAGDDAYFPAENQNSDQMNLFTTSFAINF